MKKNIFFSIFLVSLFFTVSIIIFYNFGNKDIQSKITDSKKFKEEYENLNNELKSDGINKYTEINIIEDNVIKYSTYDEIMNILEDGTGVIYFGYPECPWCRNAAPELVKVAKETGLETIYYFDNMSIRDDKILDENGNVITNKEGTEEYYDLLSKLSDYLGPYKGLNDENIKRLYVPTVIFVKDGNIVGVHMGTVESQKDPNILMNSNQIKELQEIYRENIEKVLSNSCSVDISC
ncbi:MAG: thioredoxin family protein [Bacilli bacterium]|nr:thioredoxin family protein [Bacilli bacterium]